VIVALACPRALGDNLHRHAVGEQQGGVGVPQVVKSDHRQLLLPHCLTRLDDVGDELTGEPLGVTVAAVEGAEHQGGVTDQVVRDRPADRPVGAQGSDRAGVQVDDAGLAGLRRPLDQLLALPLPLTKPTLRRTATRAAFRSMSRHRSTSASRAASR
jgi:hypothetical protein